MTVERRKLPALFLCVGLVLLAYSTVLAYDVYPLHPQPPIEADMVVEAVIIGPSSILAGLLLSVGLYGTYSGQKRATVRLCVYPLVTAAAVCVPHAYLRFSPEYNGDPSLWIALGFVVGLLVATIMAGVDAVLARPAAP